MLSQVIVFRRQILFQFLSTVQHRQRRLVGEDDLQRLRDMRASNDIISFATPKIFAIENFLAGLRVAAVGNSGP
jgi:hypothetical protein